ncbi:MAG: zf-HC2 domain-containing protein [Christensenellaceae bacterium]|nr:zf-HC2 domain-containing protein [Christensenellaceae bacterium]
MKHECDIVRDLMPLVADGTASEKSRAMVDEHIDECEPCREMFDEMRQEVKTEAPQAQAEKLVKKLRRHRMLRRALLVLLGVAISAVLVVVGQRLWLYYFEADVVLTAEENYSVEVVRKDFFGTQTIWTIKDGYAQIPNTYFDAQTGDLYLWSSTTRLRLPAASDQMVNQTNQLYYFDDLGYAYIDVLFDVEGNDFYVAVMPVNRIIKGLPEGWESRYMGTPPFTEVMVERLNPPDEALTEEWRSRLETWGLLDEWQAYAEWLTMRHIPEMETE